MQPSKITDVLNRPISQELLARDLTHLAYVAKGRHAAVHPDRVHMEWIGDRYVHRQERREGHGPAT